MAPSKRPATNEPRDVSSRKKSRNATAPNATPRRVTRGFQLMTTDAPRQAVFNTSELLEQVILCLPMKNIFGIQRVSRQFRDVIATSPKIHEKMFLRIRKDVPEETWMLDLYDGSLDTPYGNRYKPKEDVRFEKVVDMDLVKTDTKIPHAPTAKERRYYDVDDRESVTMDFSSSHFGDHPSFLKTYISDPPCYTASAAMEAYFRLDPTSYLMRGTVSGHASDQGLTIGDVVLARSNVNIHWASGGYYDQNFSDSRLEEVIHSTDPSAMGEGSSPKLTLNLSGVVIPIEEEWRAVSSEHEEITS